MTAVLRHHRYPQFRIMDPETFKVVRFQRINDSLGVLVVNEDDPGYENIMRVARADPAITIETTGILTCDECSETFSGKMAKAHLGKHQKATGHAKASESGEKVQQAAEFVCPVENLAFRNEAELVRHTVDVHAPAPPKEPDVPDPGAVVQGSLTTTNNGIAPARRTGG